MLSRIIQTVARKLRGAEAVPGRAVAEPAPIAPANEAVAVSPPIDIYAEHAKWMALAGQRDFDGAIELCLSTIKAPDTSFVASLFLGYAYFQSGRPSEAQRHLIPAVALNAGDFYANLLLAHVEKALGVFRPGLVQLQDYDYWLRAAAAGMSLAELGPRVVRYRRHSGNLSLQGGSVASAAETVPVIKTVLETGMPEELRRAFPYFFEPVADSSVPLTSFDKASLLLSHPRDELRMAGLEYAIALAEDPSFIAKASRLGLNLNRLAQKSL